MHTFNIPAPITEKLEELYRLVEANPISLPLTEVADFLGMNPDSLRCSIEQNRCPFGLEWQRTIHGNRAFKIPTVPFFMWYTQGKITGGTQA